MCVEIYILVKMLEGLLKMTGNNYIFLTQTTAILKGTAPQIL